MIALGFGANYKTLMMHLTKSHCFITRIGSPAGTEWIRSKLARKSAIENEYLHKKKDVYYTHGKSIAPFTLRFRLKIKVCVIAGHYEILNIGCV